MEVESMHGRIAEGRNFAQASDDPGQCFQVSKNKWSFSFHDVESIVSSNTTTCMLPDSFTAPFKYYLISKTSKPINRCKSSSPASEVRIVLIHSLGSEDIHRHLKFKSRKMSMKIEFKKVRG